MQEEFHTNKIKAEKLYATLQEVYCPYFGEQIVFNSKGLEHLKFKRHNHARNIEDQHIRFKLLKYAPKVLMLSKTVQGILEQKVFENLRSNHKNEFILVDAMYYEFIAVISNVRVRVIVKQINNGKKYFWSIIPFWKKGTQNRSRIYHYGSPEED